MIQNTTRAWIELYSEALYHNVSVLKRAIGNAFLAPVIKCNAYGHGLLDIGMLCEKSTDIDYMCVAFLSEALELRAAGVTKSIIVLSYADVPLEESIGKQISFVVDTYEEVYQLDCVAQKYKKKITIHVKVETGLARRGVHIDKIFHFMQFIAQLQFIHIGGVCTHFVSSYDKNNPITQQQITLFESVMKKLKALSLAPSIVHISNSSLTSTSTSNLFRIGIALYGYTPKPIGVSLKQVLSLKSRIMALKEYVPHTYIGYDATYRTERHTVCALLPIGYADGYDRRFSNRGFVWLHGKCAPVRGVVGMNLLMIDVTDIPMAQIGDEVILLGPQKGVRATDLIVRIGITNVRVLLAGLSASLPRVIR